MGEIPPFTRAHWSTELQRPKLQDDEEAQPGPTACCSLAEGLIALRAWPSMVVDKSARILAANAAARQLLAEANDWIAGTDNQLQCGEPGATAMLHARVSDIAAATSNSAARYAEFYSGSDGTEVLVVFARIAGGDDASGVACDHTAGSVLITVNDGKWRHSQCDARLLIETFELTPTEARLALSLLEGQTVQSFADASDIRISTARWHLRNALAKCNCSGQRDFVRLMRSIIEL